MSFRITHKYLQHRFEALADLMGWEHKGPAWAQVGGEMRSVIGHTFLVHNSVYGYSIACMVNTAGAESQIKASCSAQEMDAWLAGAIFAAYEFNRARDAA